MRNFALRPEFADLPWAAACGLRPRVWICVRAGFSREELKEAILHQGQALNAQAFISLDQLASQIIGRQGRETLTSRESRQEFLNELLRFGAIVLRDTGELRRLRRLPGFLRKLDRSFQTARIVSLSQAERYVLDELLTDRNGPSILRSEVLELLPQYESLVTEVPDLPGLLQQALERMNGGVSQLPVPHPDELWVFSGARPEALEAEFWERFSRVFSIPTRFFPDRGAGPSGARWLPRPEASSCHWERWHTLDDAALRVVEVLRSDVGVENLPRACVVIPDDPGVRRSLLRALAEGGIPLEDRRDPTRIRKEEAIKSALLGLEVVARDCEREAVCAWLEASCAGHPQLSPWIKAIQESGVRSGLSAYPRTGKLAPVRELLEELERQFGGRKTVTELSLRHLRLLESWVGVDAEKLWVLQFFQRFWKSFEADLERAWRLLKVSPPRLRVRAWLERVEARLRDAKPPEEREKLLGGLSLYRLSQVPVREFDHVLFFGLPALALQPSETADYFLSARDRDLLGVEFQVQSTARAREDLHFALGSWFQAAQKLHFLDAERDPDGRERPALDSLFLELFGLDWRQSFQCESKGGTPRWSRGYGLSSWRSTTRVESPHRVFVEGAAKPSLDASDLEAMSRCGFQALFGRRWKLEDLRLPGPDLWADASGTLLHLAVKELVQSRVPGTVQFSLTPREALQEAWDARPPLGLLRGRRVEELEKRRLTRILERFHEEEVDYLSRSGATTIVADDRKLKLELPAFRVQGVPDRIDEHPDGLLVADYKSSSAVPQGDEMIEQGYRLQLPFYGLAAAAETQKPVIAAQFITLSAAGGRKKGIFFRPWNGKEEGKLTTFSRKTKSLFDEAPADVWAKAQEQIERVGQAYIAGSFEARPFNLKECDRCRFRGVCGVARRGSEELDSADATEKGETS